MPVAAFGSSARVITAAVKGHAVSPTHSDADSNLCARLCGDEQTNNGCRNDRASHIPDLRINYTRRAGLCFASLQTGWIFNNIMTGSREST